MFEEQEPSREHGVHYLRLSFWNHIFKPLQHSTFFMTRETVFRQYLAQYFP